MTEMVNFEPKECKVLCEDTQAISREEWLKLRKNGIGGSEIGGLVGLSEYSTPLTIWYDKLSEDSDNDKSSVSAQIGNLLEDFILTEIESRLKTDVHNEIRVYPYKKMFEYVPFPHAIANPDGLIWHPEKGWGLYEGKTTAVNYRDEWKEDSVPPNYLAQVQWYLGIMGLKWGYFGYLIGNNEIDYTYFEFDQEFFDILLDRAKAFWMENIAKKIMPEATEFYKAESKTIGKIYPYDEGTELEMGTDDELLHLLNKRANVKKELDELDKMYNQLTNKIKLMCGTNARVYVGGWRVDYRRGTEENPQGQKRVNSKMLKARHPDIYDEVVEFMKKPYFAIRELKH